VAPHAEGGGARLVEVVIGHGNGFVLARTWTGDGSLSGGSRTVVWCRATAHLPGRRRRRRG
jgi:hypothetical protein